MFKYLVLFIAFATCVFSQNNIGVYVCSTYVKADSTGTTNALSFATKTDKIMKIAFRDSALGDGVIVKQYGGFLTYTNFKRDTIYDLIGDTVGSPFVHVDTLSADSLVCSGIDGTQVWRRYVGPLTTDSLFVSKGYRKLNPDKTPLIRFTVRGNSAFSAAKKIVYIIINTVEGAPVFNAK